ncbi:hypothetical protein Dimus_016450, partial [Dionaea muscipula]
GGDDPAAPDAQPQHPAPTSKPVQEEHEAEKEEVQKDVVNEDAEKVDDAEKEDVIEEEEENPKDDVPAEPSRGEDKVDDEDEDLSDPIGYNNPISSVDLISTDEDEVEDAQRKQGMNLLLHQGPSHHEEAATSIPFITEPSANPPPHDAITTDPKIHAHINEAVRVMLIQMEKQNEAIKSIMEFFELNAPRDKKLQANLATSFYKISDDMTRNTKDLNILAHAFRTDIPREIQEQTTSIEKKVADVNEDVKTRLGLMELKVENNNMELKHLMEKEFLEQNIKLDDVASTV